MLPLQGITVISIEHAIAAPFCTRQLADLGARVIKIERPGTGDFARGYDERVRGISSHFVWTNRSKESLTLDLKHPEGLAILKHLIQQADVFVQNLAPGAASRLGLDFSSLSTDNDRLIVCDISGYGDDPVRPGPYRDKKAYDLLIQSESGFLSVTGTDETPAKAGCSIADIAAGMYAYSNILAALYARTTTGAGKRIDISMLESMTEWMGYPLYYSFEDAPAPPRTGAAHATIYPYGPFLTGDDGMVLLGLQNEREWAVFCSDVLQQPSLATEAAFNNNPARVKNRGQLRETITAIFSTLSASQITQRLDKAGIANSRINTLQDVWTHPQLKARQRWTQIATPVGNVPALLPPGIATRSDVKMEAVPALGEHTNQILSEYGYPAARIARLRTESVI